MKQLLLIMMIILYHISFAQTRTVYDNNGISLSFTKNIKKTQYCSIGKVNYQLIVYDIRIYNYSGKNVSIDYSFGIENSGSIFNCDFEELRVMGSNDLGMSIGTGGIVNIKNNNSVTSQVGGWSNESHEPRWTINILRFYSNTTTTTISPTNPTTQQENNTSKKSKPETYTSISYGNDFINMSAEDYQKQQKAKELQYQQKQKSINDSIFYQSLLANQERERLEKEKIAEENKRKQVEYKRKQEIEKENLIKQQNEASNKLQQQVQQQVQSNEQIGSSITDAITTIGDAFIAESRRKENERIARENERLAKEKERIVIENDRIAKLKEENSTKSKQENSNKHNEEKNEIVRYSIMDLNDTPNENVYVKFNVEDSTVRIHDYGSIIRFKWVILKYNRKAVKIYFSMNDKKIWYSPDTLHRFKQYITEIPTNSPKVILYFLGDGLTQDIFPDFWEFNFTTNECHFYSQPISEEDADFYSDFNSLLHFFQTRADKTYLIKTRADGKIQVIDNSIIK